MYLFNWLQYRYVIITLSVLFLSSIHIKVIVFVLIDDNTGLVAHFMRSSVILCRKVLLQFNVHVFEGLDEMHHLDLKGWHFGQLLFFEGVSMGDTDDGFEEVEVTELVIFKRMW